MKQIIVLLFVLTSTAGLAQTNEKIVGKYVSKDDGSTVEMYKCAEAFCGKQVATPKADDKKYNGKVIAREVRWTGEQWEGTVIDPENGKEYKAIWKLAADERSLTMKVKWGIMSFSDQWIRTN